jgi:26S proteasome regulatory subunit T3
MISLVQMDGFDQTVNVKVIMATNRADTLDPALLRPGRLDRKIEFPLPDRRQKRLVFQVLILTILPLSALTLPSYEQFLCS